MSVSNVTGVSGVARIVLPANASRAAEPAANKPSEASGEPPTSAASAAASEPGPPEAPADLRFPWLSRLARKLDPVSPQPSPYGRVEILGEQLDKQA